jgi:hypothetical protein
MTRAIDAMPPSALASCHGPFLLLLMFFSLLVLLDFNLSGYNIHVNLFFRGGFMAFISFEERRRRFGWCRWNVADQFREIHQVCLGLDGFCYAVRFCLAGGANFP